MFDREINSCLGSFRQENFCLNVSLVSHYDILATKCFLSNNYYFGNIGGSLVFIVISNFIIHEHK